MIYIDCILRVSYIYLQKSMTAEEMLEGKEAFKQWALMHGVVVRAYHVDNGVFQAHAWVQACQSKSQLLMFASKNTQHQNGMAERCIRELQDSAQTMLIHTNHRWPTAINAHLWLYAFHTVNKVYNVTPCLQDKEVQSPVQVYNVTPCLQDKEVQSPNGWPTVINAHLCAPTLFTPWTRCTMLLHACRTRRSNLQYRCTMLLHACRTRKSNLQYRCSRGLPWALTQKHYQPFRCLVYILDFSIQERNEGNNLELASTSGSCQSTVKTLHLSWELLDWLVVNSTFRLIQDSRRSE